jgi:hypothetical protein
MPAQHIPTVRYHPTEAPRTIETIEALAALGPEWLDHPYSDEDKATWQASQDEAAETPTPRSRR